MQLDLQAINNMLLKDEPVAVVVVTVAGTYDSQILQLLTMRMSIVGSHERSGARITPMSSGCHVQNPSRC
jgi:hypothetical protein